MVGLIVDTGYYRMSSTLKVVDSYAVIRAFCSTSLVIRLTRTHVNSQ